MTIHFQTEGPVALITIDRPEVSNAIDGPTATALADAFRRFEAAPDLRVSVLSGSNGCFCAGNDLKSMQKNDPKTRIRVEAQGDAPCGVSRLLLTKPVIAAVEGYAVAGGLEVACWCDMRVASEDAVFGVFCRRWGIPLMDGGTIRLTRLIGHSHALDMILTGRGVSGEEARMMGLANRLVAKGTALEESIALAHQLAALPQAALKSDRLSSYEQWHLNVDDALSNEFRHGMATLATEEMVSGLARFEAGEWREQKSES